MNDVPATDPAEPGGPEDQSPGKRRNPWIWISVVLALVAIGLLVWALNTKSDLDNAEQEADAAQSQLEQGKETGSAALKEGKTAYDDVTKQLGATTEDLDACLLYTSPSPRDRQKSRMPSSA